MAKPMSFRHFMNAEYTQSGDEQQDRNAQKRHNGVFDESLTIAQRKERGRMMKRYKSRIAMGRKRAERRVANLEVLKKRARKHARDQIVRKITKDIPKSELTDARKKDIEKRLEKPAMQRKIERSAKKMLPRLRSAEIAKKRGHKSND